MSELVHWYLEAKESQRDYKSEQADYRLEVLKNVIYWY